MPGKRQAGWPSLLVTYLSATQETSNSDCKASRKRFFFSALQGTEKLLFSLQTAV
jgi:hypothetical protein